MLWLDRARIATLTAILCLPLVVVPSLLFPFVVPRALLFQALVAVACALHVVRWAFGVRPDWPRPTALGTALLLFVASAVVSTLLGAEPGRGWWDTAERMFGLDTLLLLTVYYFLCRHALASDRVARVQGVLVLGVGLCVGAVAAWQRIDPDLFFSWTRQGRPHGTLGHWAYLGGCGLLLAFVGVWLRSRTSSRALRALGLVGAIAGPVIVILSEARSALVGLGAAAVAILVHLALRSDRVTRRRVAAAVAGMLVVLLILGSQAEREWVRKIPGVGFLAATTLDDPSVDKRLITWKVAVDVWSARPLVGWGWNGFYHGFNRYFDPQLTRYRWQETRFDDAHNLVLNVLGEQGLVGLVSLCLCIGAVWRAARRLEDERVLLVARATVIAYLVHLLFVFADLSSAILAAWCCALLEPARGEPETGKRSPAALAAAAVVVMAAAGFVESRLQAWRSAAEVTLAAQAMPVRPAEAVEHWRLVSEKRHPHRVEHELVLASQSLERIRATPRDTMRALASASGRALDQGIERSPRDDRLEIWRGRLALAEIDAFQDSSRLPTALEGLQRVLRHTPDRADTHFMLAALEFESGRREDAIARLRERIERAPTIGEAYWRLALIYEAVGRRDEAVELMRLARERNVSFRREGQAVLDRLLPD